MRVSLVNQRVQKYLCSWANFDGLTIELEYAQYLLSPIKSCMLKWAGWVSGGIGKPDCASGWCERDKKTLASAG